MENSASLGWGPPHFTRDKMKIFSDEFTDFLKRTLICFWRGHKRGKWIEVYWAVAHSAGYKSRFCEICHKELETTRRKATFVPSEV